MGPRTVQWLAVGACIGLVAAGAQLMPAINAERRSMNMIGTERPEENAPPEYAFMVQAFGAFRGVLTNFLFIRAEDYKQQGRYYDAMQLASWICTLQPRFPSVWEFHAWNMAWNISVTTHTPEERWNWVYNGARLLRDQGLRYNPRAINLYRQLAWIFVNKMSETTDDHHMTYKRNWAWRMHLVLGQGPDRLGRYDPQQPFELLPGGIGDDELTEVARRVKMRRDAEKGIVLPDAPPPPAPRSEEISPSQVVKRAAFEFIDAIAKAPTSLDALFEAVPETRALVDGLRGLGADISDAELNEDAYWNQRGLAYTFFLPWRQLEDSSNVLAHVIRDNRRGFLSAIKDERLAEFERVAGVQAGNPAARELLRFLQRKVLLEVYKLDPAEMATLIETFGPMDWRVVDAHSLYWVNKALIAGEETVSTFKNDKTNTSRLIFFSLRNLYQRNRLVFEPLYADINRSYLNFGPDINFIEPMHQAYLTYGPMIDPSPGTTGGAGDTFRTGHINFLSESIRLLYFAGRRGEAAHYYQYLQDTYGWRADGSMDPPYAKTLRDYVMDTFLESEMSWKDARMAIAGLMMQGLGYLAEGNQEYYYNFVTQARAYHAAFGRGYDDQGVAEKMELPPFADMLTDAVKLLMSQPALSPETALAKARLWYYLPPEFAQRVYDALLPQFQREAQLFEFDVARAFPEPPGMAEYRASAPLRAEEERQGITETPVQANP